MYGVVKNVINSKRYELAEMLKKIDTLWVRGSITEEQRTELILLAQNNAKVENSVDILRKLGELDKRVTALEKVKTSEEDESASGEGSGEVAEGENNESESAEDGGGAVYPEYEAGKWYYAGDTISFNGSNYVCVAPEGAVCVWSPADYPTYWGLVIEESAGTTEEDSEVEEIE